MLKSLQNENALHAYEIPDTGSPGEYPLSCNIFLNCAEFHPIKQFLPASSLPWSKCQFAFSGEGEEIKAGVSQTFVPGPVRSAVPTWA